MAAWALQALRDEFHVTLGTLGPVDYENVNRNFGTSLREGDFEVRLAPLHYKALERIIPTRGALLQLCMTMRLAQMLDAQEHFDILLGTENEADFGRPGVQYVHFPWVYLPRPRNELNWFHYIPGFLTAYRVLCGRLGHISNEGLRRNLSLANSTFVAGAIRRVHSMDSIILHPPVPGEFPEVPWERKRAAVIAVGRIHPCKRWDMAVEIMDRVRQHGLELGLTLIGARDDREYGRRLAALAATRPWFRILNDLTREQLIAEVAAHRYGIHTMENEHFGIAVAELLRGGTIPFVHDSGGPVEIVGGREELRFRNAAEGAEKIAAINANSSLEQDLRDYLHQLRDCFSTERFCRELREILLRHAL